MSSEVHKQAVELLLTSIYPTPGDGPKMSFMYGRPGAPSWDRRLGAEVHFREPELVRAALYVRKVGAAYLRYLPIEDVWALLQKFVAENFAYFTEGNFSQRFESSYGERVPNEATKKLAAALGVSELFRPADSLTLFPLVPVEVTQNFDSASFMVIRAADLDESRLRGIASVREILPTQFPPLANWSHRKETAKSWLGIWSPAYPASKKMKAAILGALALTQSRAYRYMFSGRAMFGGRYTLGGGSTMSFGTPHTPSLMENIVVSSRDGGWLSSLAVKLADGHKSDRRQLNALEYFYRAWPLAKHERFPIMCMALDSIFGDANRATQAVIDGVRGALGDHVSDCRLRDLMYLRAAVVHGGAPDVYDSSKYENYYKRYEADPIEDLEVVVAECLRKIIFGDLMVEHPNPYEHREGRVKRRENSILGSS